MWSGRGSGLLCPLRGSAYSLSFQQKKTSQEPLPEPGLEEPLEKDTSPTAEVQSLASHRGQQTSEKGPSWLLAHLGFRIQNCCPRKGGWCWKPSCLGLGGWEGQPRGTPQPLPACLQGPRHGHQAAPSPGFSVPSLHGGWGQPGVIPLSTALGAEVSPGQQELRFTTGPQGAPSGEPLQIPEMQGSLG